MADVSDLQVSAEQAARQARRLGLWARVVLVPVAAIGAVLSFRSLYQAAVPTFGDYLATGFPLLVDLLILGASLQYVAGAKIGRPMAGWRLTAHAGVAGTLVLNALAAKELGEVPWHITAPAVWAVLVELTAKQVLGEWKATHTAKADRISLPLWMTAPVESVRTRLLMFRTGINDAHQARIAVGVNAAAREALRLALPRRNARRVRRIINRQLRAGSLTPVAILRPLGWTRGGKILNNARPDVILQAVLQEVLDPGAPPVEVEAAAPPVARSWRRPVDRSQAEFPEAGFDPEAGLDPEMAFDPEVGFDPETGLQPAVRSGRTGRSGAPARAAGRPRGSRPAGVRPMAQAPLVTRRPGTAPNPAMAPQPETAQYPESAQQPDRTLPLGVDLRPGMVQQPARALQLGRALHRGRVLQQTGSAEGAASTAEQLRMELARVQTPRFEPPQFQPMPGQEPADLFEPAPQQQQPLQQPQPPVEYPMAERQMDQHPMDQHPMDQHPMDQHRRERPSRGFEPFRAPTAVMDPHAGGPVVGRADGHFDDVEILEDMEHVDELDGQAYPDDFDGIERANYIDLDDPARSARPHRSDTTVTMPR